MNKLAARLFGAGVVSIVCFVIFDATPSRISMQALALGAYYEPEKPCVLCDVCEYNEVAGHFTATGAAASRNANGEAAHPSVCKQDVCESAHPATGQCSNLAIKNDPVTVKDFLAALTATDSEVVREFVEAHPASVSVNHERKAVQLLGCSGLVIAHIAISTDQLATLETLE